MQSSKERRAALIAAAKTETRPLAEWCHEYGLNEHTAAAYLVRAGVPYKGRRQAREEKMLALHAKGLDCQAIATEMGMASGWYVYYRLIKLGAKPAKPPSTGNVYMIGGRRMSKEMPRNIRMLGDLKRGFDTAKMMDKYGVCRERIGQVRAFGIEAGLLP